MFRIRGALSRFWAVVADAFQREEQAPSDPILGSRQFKRRLGWATLVALAVITLGGFVLVRSELTKASAEAYRNLEAIATLKAQQITQWRQERLSEALFLSRTPAVSNDIKAMLEQPDNPAAREAVHGWLANIKAGDRYEGIMVYDAQGVLRYAIPDNLPEHASHFYPWVVRALANPQVSQVDLHLDKSSGTTHLSFLVPLQQQAGAGEDARPIGLILLMLDPANHLYPLIQTWPIPSATGESFLVRRDGNEAVYLNELRHQAGTALTLRFPIDDPMLPAARALRGETGMLAGRDYRGVEVLYASRPIVGSTWVLIAKVDAAEIFGPIRWQVFKSSISFGLLIIAVVLAAMILWRHRVHRALQLKLRAEQERNELASRLLLLTQHANDIILRLDRQGYIKEANDRAVSTYGYTLAELQQLPPGGLRTAESAHSLDTQFQQFSAAQGAIIETMHRRKDGSVFHVEISGRSVAGVDGSILLVIRDISQRKAHEAEIQRLNRLYNVLSQVNQAIVHAVDRELLMQEVCRVLVESGGFAMAWIGSVDPVTGQVMPVARHGDCTNYLDTVVVRGDATPEGQGPAGKAIRDNSPQIFNEFQSDPRTKPWHAAARRAGFNSVVALPVPRPDVPVDVLLVYSVEHQPFGKKEIDLLQEAASDVSFGLQILARDAQRRQAEQALLVSEERWRHAVQGSAAGIWEVNYPERDAYYSDRSKEILGYTSEEIPNQLEAWTGLIHPDDVALGQQAMADHLVGRNPYYEVVHRMRCKDGSYKWISSHAQAVFDAAGVLKRIAGTHVDITQLMEAEAALRGSLHEKEALLKEVHHRVKNNLQVITSLLRLEAGKSRSPDSKGVLGDMQNRIRSMALLHETLYRSGNFARIDLGDYLHKLATQLFRSQNTAPERVRLELALVPVTIEIDQAIPCGLIVNELLTNALKHAFPDGRTGEIRLITQMAKDDQISLVVTDNGVGLPANLDVRRTSSLGLQLVSDLTRQLSGILENGPGATFTITFAPRRDTASPFPS